VVVARASARTSGATGGATSPTWVYLLGHPDHPAISQRGFRKPSYSLTKAYILVNTSLVHRAPRPLYKANGHMNIYLNSSSGCVKNAASMQHQRVAAWGRLAVVLGVAAAGACGTDPTRTGSGSLSGYVVVSGPLSKAAVSVDQLDPTVTSSVAIRAHVGDTVTDDQGKFTLDVSAYSGLLLVTAKGGSFTDLASRAVVEIDPGDGLESIVLMELFEVRDDALVSPVGHLVATRTRTKMDQLKDLTMAQEDAQASLDRQFAGVPWSRVRLASLATAATSPTEPVRAALVQAALSYLAKDIADAAGASSQEVNVLRLAQQLAVDLGQDGFDGNDHDDPTLGSGLQLGTCGPVAGCTAPAAPDGDICAREACRPQCDLYAGTTRSLLAGEMTKIIRNPAINGTGLVSGDILAVARAMADNADPELFAPGGCSKSLDRTPPTLTFGAAPADGDFVRGAVTLTVTAIDDVDVPPSPEVGLLGYSDTDGDLHNNVATAVIDTTRAADGALTVTATTADAAGNAAMITRALQVDNTVPVVALDATGFFDDGATWWTSDPHPVLRGVFSEAHPVSVEAVIGSTHLPLGTIVGSTWSVAVPDGSIGLAGADVRIVFTDAAGNQGTAVQHIRYDANAPAMSVQPSNVHDEASDTQTFDSNEVPVHIHGGTSVDLADRACLRITKFSYLLGTNPPPYGAENERNPLHYELLVSDDGVGFDSGTTQYRVGRDDASGTQWFTSFVTAGPGSPVGTGTGAVAYTVPLYADTVPGLDTVEGTYRVEFQSTDRLGRKAIAVGCFDLHLRAPPLHFQTPGQVAPDPDPIPVNHLYRLESLNWSGEFNAFAARLLNNNATGASLLDKDVTNGTASTVYLEVGVTRPTSVFAQQNFVLRNFSTSSSASFDCTEDGNGDTPARCSTPAGGPVYTRPTSTGDEQVPNLQFPVKVFELDSNLHPATEIPCVVCGIGDRWKFAIPPRAVNGSARRFKVMTMIGQVQQLWPSDASFLTSPPFQDTTVNGIKITGRVSATNVGCTTHSTHTVGGVILDTCTRLTTIVPYRALTAVHLRIEGILTSTYATAATASTTSAQNTSGQMGPAVWDRFAGTLP